MTTASSTPSQATPPAPGYRDRRTDHLRRLHKVEGQVRGIARMVEDDRYTQVSAATHALQEVALGLFDDHVRHCVADAVRNDPAGGEQKLTELTEAMRRALRL